MSDSATDARAKVGTPADRSPLRAVAGTAIGSGAVGLLVGTMDWLLKCQAAHHFVSPDNALVVMWATALAPVAQLTYKIWINRLTKAAGEAA